MKTRLRILKKAGISLITLLFINSIAQGANFTAITSGSWSNAGTWGGTAPSFTNTTDVVTIPSGMSVTLDNNLTVNGALSSVVVMGTLTSSTSTNLIVSQGSISGTGVINIGNLTLGTLSSLLFTGSLTVNTLTSSTLNLQTSATTMINQALTITTGTLSIQSGGTLTLATNSELVMAGGVLAINGGSLGLTNNYNVTYASAASATSGIELTGTGLKNVTLNFTSTNHTLSLSSDLTVNGVLTLTKGTLFLGLSNLVILGEVATNGTGTISSTSASDISINSTSGITGSLNFKGTNNAVNNFTVNVGAANRAQIKGFLAVNGSLNLTSGTLVLDSSNVKINGTISATGTGTISTTTSSEISVSTPISPLGEIRFAASSAVKNLKVNIANTGTLKIASNLNIQDTLTLTKGSIDISSNYIQLGSNGMLIGADSNSYIKTSGAGYLGMWLMASGLNAMLFPVGTSAKYFPAGIMLNVGSTSGNMKVGVISNVYAMGDAGTDISTTQRVVDATWMIQSDITANLNMNLNLMWSASSEVNGFNRSMSYISHYTSTNGWDVSTKQTAGLNVRGFYNLTRTNITSLSPFTVFDNTSSSVIETKNNNNIEVYPIPTNDVIFINNETNNNEVLHANLVDINGKLIANYELTGNNKSISLNDFQPGYYFLKLTGNNTNLVKKIIKL